MRRETGLWEFIQDLQKHGVASVLMVVAESKGSSPGRSGFMMAVSTDSIYGSIGGGVMEVALVEKARRILSTGSDANSWIRQVHRQESEESSGMICSGEQIVLFCVITPDETELTENCIEAVKRHDGKSLRIDANSISVVENQNASASFRAHSENEFEYIQPLADRHLIDIIGGGHCALALSELMSMLGFSVSIFDDRPGLNTIEKNEFADTINIVESYETVGGLIDEDSNKYVVVMTIGYKYDKVVIRQLLGKRFKYLGVLGSKAKMSSLLRELRDEGVDSDLLDSIHTPIGIEINSRTPVEIAVSIAAQIIKIKNGETK